MLALQKKSKNIYESKGFIQSSAIFGQLKNDGPQWNLHGTHPWNLQPPQEIRGNPHPPPSLIRLCTNRIHHVLTRCRSFLDIFLWFSLNDNNLFHPINASSSTPLAQHFWAAKLLCLGMCCSKDSLSSLPDSSMQLLHFSRFTVWLQKGCQVTGLGAKQKTQQIWINCGRCWFLMLSNLFSGGRVVRLKAKEFMIFVGFDSPQHHLGAPSFYFVCLFSSDWNGK